MAQKYEFRPPARRHTKVSIAALALFVFAVGTLTFAAEPIAPVNRLPRIALVIGNAKYPQAPLKNPHNDASAIAEQLKRMGFDVTVKLDATKSDMEGLIRAFGTKLRQHNGVGFFYFAGHGAQLSWRNYLIPVDAAIANVADMQKQAVDLGTLLETFDFARNPVNVVVLDACRDNPLGNDVRLEQKGFSQVDAPPGTLLAYATAPGNVAADGARANGMYTEHLLKEMVAPDAKIEDVLKRVRLAVRRESRGQQIPWESTSLEHDFYFIVPTALKKATLEVDDKSFEEEAALWDKLVNTRERSALESYLHRYPSGRFSELVQFRLDRLLGQQGEKRVEVQSGAANPFSKGTGKLDVGYAVGDEYRYRRVDRLAGSTPIESVGRISQITDSEVIYNEGKFITDFMGNADNTRFGTRERGRQFYISEYSVGKKWSTRFTGVAQKGTPLVIEIDFVVLSKEPVTIAAGTFDAFKVQGRGTNNFGSRLEYLFWVAPDRVRRELIWEHVWRDRSGKVYSSERQELISYRQLRDPQKAP